GQGWGGGPARPSQTPGVPPGAGNKWSSNWCPAPKGKEAEGRRTSWNVSVRFSSALLVADRHLEQREAFRRWRRRLGPVEDGVDQVIQQLPQLDRLHLIGHRFGAGTVLLD